MPLGLSLSRDGAEADMWSGTPLFPEQASTMAGRVDALYFFLIAISTFFSLLIAGLIVFFAVKYRRRAPESVGAVIHGGLLLELAWTIIPFLISMMIFVWGASVFFAMSRPPDEATWGEIRAAFEEHSVLVFHDQPLDDESQIAFSRRFGPLEVSGSVNPAAGTHFARQSNLDVKTGDPIPAEDRRMVYQRANMLWHTDSSFKTVPSLCSLLSGRIVPPEGGDTEFASTRCAYPSLPEDLRRKVEGAVAVHSFAWSRDQVQPGFFTDTERAEYPPVRHPMVRVNPVNGRKALFLGAHASHIEGMPLEEGRALLAAILEHVTQPEFRYRHRWREGDLVIWDNRCVLHRATPFDAGRHRRLMQRTTVAGDATEARPLGQMRS